MRYWGCFILLTRAVMAALPINLAAAATSPQSGTADSPRWYGGINAGQSRVKTNNGRTDSRLIAAGAATATTAFEQERTTAYKLYGGYQFNRNVAVEGGYFDLGRFSSVTSTTGPTGALASESKPRGMNLDAVGMLPVPYANNLSVFARVGAHATKTNDTYAASGSVAVATPTTGKWDTNLKLGVGLQYDLTKSVGLRGEVERYRLNDAFNERREFDVYSLGLTIKFQ